MPLKPANCCLVSLNYLFSFSKARVGKPVRLQILLQYNSHYPYPVQTMVREDGNCSVVVDGWSHTPHPHPKEKED